jgi:N-formylmaleamate deformylase
LKYTEGDVQINGTKIHYYRTGKGRSPFVLLHGASDNGLCWTPVAEVLGESYDVIMPDAQGHGKSDRINPGKVESQPDQVVGLLQKLGIQKPIIMGHSMGAGTTANIAAEQPELPRAIILEDPAWMDAESLTPEVEAQRARQRESFFKTFSENTRRTREELIAQCRKANPRWSEGEIIPWAEAKLQFDPALFANMPVNFPSYEGQVPRMICPALLITSDGGIVQPAVAKRAATLWKAKSPFRSVQIKGAGHNIRRDQFAAFMEAVQSFLKEVA